MDHSVGALLKTVLPKEGDEDTRPRQEKLPKYKNYPLSVKTVGHQFLTIALFGGCSQPLRIRIREEGWEW